MLCWKNTIKTAFLTILQQPKWPKNIKIKSQKLVQAQVKNWSKHVVWHSPCWKKEDKKKETYKTSWTNLLTLKGKTWTSFGLYNIYVYMRPHIYIYIHTPLSVYIHTYIHTYIQTYMNTDIAYWCAQMEGTKTSQYSYLVVILSNRVPNNNWVYWLPTDAWQTPISASKEGIACTLILQGATACCWIQIRITTTAKVVRPML